MVGERLKGMRYFDCFIGEATLRDYSFEWGLFTWPNGSVCSNSKIDRFLFLLEWEEMFNFVK